MAAPHELSAVQLLALYASRVVLPFELAQAAIAHSEAWEPRLHATYAFDPEDAMARAQAQLGIVQMTAACGRMRPAPQPRTLPPGA